MKKLILLLFALAGVKASGQTLVDSFKREIVFTSVNVIPMDSERVLQNQMVVVKEGKVTAIGKKLKYSKSAVVIDASGKYLIPGLAEMHAHVPPNDNLEAHKEVLFLFAAHGITTIRGMLGHPRHLEVREMLKREEIVGPKLFTTGPSFNGLSVKTPERGAEMVKEQKTAGYDFLKLHPGLTKETFAAISKTANELKIPFVGHVSFGVGIDRAIEAGYSTIDHLDGFVEGMVPGIDKMVEQQAGLFGMFVADKVDLNIMPKILQGLKEKNIWMVPTQSLAERWFDPQFTGDVFMKDPNHKYIDKKIVDQWIESKKNLMSNPQYDAVRIKNYIELRRKIIAECQKKGVGILLGCDAPQVFNVPGISTHYELKYLVEAGLTPYQALQAGTINVARYLNLPNTGTIAPGNIADLLLVNGNPLEDIVNTQNVEGVMLRGRWLSNDQIKQGLQKIEK